MCKMLIIPVWRDSSNWIIQPTCVKYFLKLLLYIFNGFDWHNAKHSQQSWLKIPDSREGHGKYIINEVKMAKVKWLWNKKSMKI